MIEITKSQKLIFYVVEMGASKSCFRYNKTKIINHKLND